MRRITRRSALRALGASAAVPVLGTASAGRGRLRTLVDLPGDPVPENLAFDESGNLYFSVVAGEVRRIPADRTDETGLTLDDTELVGSLPGNAVGVDVGPDGTVYVASHADSDTGVWAIPPDGDPAPLAAIGGFPNDVRYDSPRDRLLVTESFGGVVHEVPLDHDEPSATRWATDPALDTDGLGANGLTVRDGSVLVTVTQATADGADVGRLVEFPIDADGSAGAGRTVLESQGILGADGVTSVGPHVYVAANARNELVRLNPGGRTRVVANGDDGLVFPSDALLGREGLFVCNFANEQPGAGAIFRLRGR